ncbi:MAG: U32 family peptidase [Planctomycetaceae bacterium]|nr:U32 family peptidase [Planctomycetaceae bacterium]
MELLAPAGDLPCLEAAIEAGADAVYLGLSLMNARRGAKNFTPAELEKAAELARKHDVRTHLTMNIDISKRELGGAARILSLARDIGIDAIIARDWAVVGLWQALQDASAREDRSCPVLHLSTQSAVTNVEGARLARDIGVSRVVLARELSLREIEEIGKGSGIEIEVFAQGALCYSISGRCLLSSWGGGRSGNRGLCASPCRVPWAVDGEAVGTAMSMRDLVTVDRLAELSAAGVDSIKIEGRLKKPEWVREAVSLYRTALGPRKTDDRPARLDKDTVVRARRLAAYAGRDTTSAYLDGSFYGLTGIAARKSSRAADDAIEEFMGGGSRYRAPAPAEVDADDGYQLEINVTDKGLSCRCRYKGRSESWRMPKTRIKREKKAISIDDLFDFLRKDRVGEAELNEFYSNEPDFMLPPRNVKTVVATVHSFINRLTGKSDNGEDAVLKAPLPDPMRAALATPPPDETNSRRLGERPNQARVNVKQLNSSLLPVLKNVDLVLQGATIHDMEFVAKFVDPPEYIVSFPDVYFPAESADQIALGEYCKKNNIRVEANCWGSVWLCRELGLDFTTGPGIPVLNPLAVKCLRDLGAQGVTVSMEADRQQIEDVCSGAVLPLTLLVYARPVLAYTRIPKESLLPFDNAKPGHDGAWTDRRGISLQPEGGSTLTVFRSLSAFDWKTLSNDNIRVANLTIDLSGESYPVDVWKRFIRPGGRRGFLFNYDRGLQ